MSFHKERGKHDGESSVKNQGQYQSTEGAITIVHRGN